MKRQPAKIKRTIFSSKEGYLVKTVEEGIERWSKPKNRAELRTEILKEGVCEHVAENLISQAIQKKETN